MSRWGDPGMSPGTSASHGQGGNGGMGVQAPPGKSTVATYQPTIVQDTNTGEVSIVNAPVLGADLSGPVIPSTPDYSDVTGIKPLSQLTSPLTDTAMRKLDSDPGIPIQQVGGDGRVMEETYGKGPLYTGDEDLEGLQEADLAFMFNKGLLEKDPISGEIVEGRNVRDAQENIVPRDDITTTGTEDTYVSPVTQADVTPPADTGLTDEERAAAATTAFQASVEAQKAANLAASPGLPFRDYYVG